MGVNLSIKGVPLDLAQRLRERAKRNHRSLQRELMAIIEAAARESTPHLPRSESPAPPLDPEDRRSSREITGSKSVDEVVDALRARFPQGSGDDAVLSVDMVRDARDAR